MKKLFPTMLGPPDIVVLIKICPNDVFLPVRLRDSSM